MGTFPTCSRAADRSSSSASRPHGPLGAGESAERRARFSGALPDPTASDEALDPSRSLSMAEPGAAGGKASNERRIDASRGIRPARRRAGRERGLLGPAPPRDFASFCASPPLTVARHEEGARARIGGAARPTRPFEIPTGLGKACG